MDHDDVLEQLELAAVEPGGLDRLDGRRYADGGCRRRPPRGLRALRRGAAPPRPRRAARCATSSGRRRQPTSASGRSRTSASTVGRGARGIGGEPVPHDGVAADDACRAGPSRRRATAPAPAMGRDDRGRGRPRRSRRRLRRRPRRRRPAWPPRRRRSTAWSGVQRATLGVSGERWRRARRARCDGWRRHHAARCCSRRRRPSSSSSPTDLARPPSGQEYRCWVEIDGQRQTSARCSSRTIWPSGSARRPRSAELPAGDAVRGVTRPRSGARRSTPTRSSAASSDGRRVGPAPRDSCGRRRRAGIVGRRCLEIGPVEREQALGGLGADVAALVLEHPREPERLARPLGRRRCRPRAAASPSTHEPHQPGPHDEPDDEQPPVELGVHRREV